MKKRLSMPEQAWPIEDRQLWHSALQPMDIFDDGGAAARWRAKTVVQAKYAYGRWLQHLVTRHYDALANFAPARVTVERVRQYIGEMSTQMTAVSVAASLGHLVLALRAIAPANDWQWLTRMQRKQLAKAKFRDKRPFMVRADELVTLGVKLMSIAESDGIVHDIRDYRDGLMIALLAARPLRRSNFAAMRLNKHVAILSNQVTISFDAQEMKGCRPFTCWMPSSLVAHFLRYVNDVRPRFLGATMHDFVWCSMKGRALQADGIYQMITKRTMEAFGKPVHPHLIRDIAATSIAMDRPEQVQLARDLLGHASLKTTERHYLHAQSARAGACYVQLIRDLRSRRQRTYR
jgi:integrase/recombinase XerD